MALVSSRMRSSVIMALPYRRRALADRFRREHGGTSAPDQGFILKGRSIAQFTVDHSGRSLHPLVPFLLEPVAQNLAAIAFRQFRHNDGVLGHLWRRQVRPAVLDHSG